MTLETVTVAHALIWEKPEIAGRSLGELRMGQLVLVGEPGPDVVWRDQPSRLLKVQAQGREGWMLASQLRTVSLPAWATALSGPFDPFANPENACGQLAPPPRAGGEFRLIARESGDRVRFEAGCMEAREDGSTVASTRQGIASILDFALVEQVESCSKRLESLDNRSAELKAVWPADPAICDVLKIEAMDPPFPGTQTTWRIDLEGAEHPAEGFVANGRWLPTHDTNGKRLFDGPDYVLMALEKDGRFVVQRLGLSPPSVLIVLDKPITGEGGEAFATAEKGQVQGDKGTHCEWVPGRKQYYRCN